MGQMTRAALAAAALVPAATFAAWTPLGPGPLNVDVTRNAGEPTVALLGQTPIVSWTEVDASGSKQLYAKSWNGATWIQLGATSLNVNPTGHDSNEPDLVVHASTPHVSWFEKPTPGGV